MKTSTLKNLLPLLLLVIGLYTHAQNYEYGHLDKGDLELKECPFEKDASAVVLFDKGNSWFVQEEGSFTLRFDRHVRIKIFDEAAFDQAEFEIPLFIGDDDLEKIRDISGITYNIENGKVEKTKLSSDNVFRESINDNWYLKKFAMPKIKEGSIIDVKYSIYSPYYTHFKDWEFQTDIPTLYSEYKVNMIPFYSYQFRLQGANGFDHFKKYEKSGMERVFAHLPFKDMVYEFGFEDIPSFKDESFISSRNDYVKKIVFQLAEINHPSGYTQKIMQTWPALSEELLDHNDFGKYLKKAEKWGEKTFAHLAEKPEAEKIEEILNYFKTNYKWNDYNGKFAQESLKDFNNKLSGNIGNINLATIGALRSVGISAKPVIISTRSNGKVTDKFPYSKLFNYVLIAAETDGKIRLLDATRSLSPNHLIPSGCLNGKGYIVEEDSYNWVKISNNSPSIEEINLSLNINPEEQIVEGFCKTKCTGYIALSERNDFYNDSEKFTKTITNKGITITDDLETLNLTDKEKPFLYNYSFDRGIDVIEDQLILSPFANLCDHDNPFKQEKRSLPIDLVYIQGNRLISTITIPDGYKVDEIPINRTINSKNVSFNYMAKVTGNKIQVVAIYQYKKQSYPADAYKELKDFMNTVTAKINSKIVLSKDSNEITSL